MTKSQKVFIDFRKVTDNKEYIITRIIRYLIYLGFKGVRRKETFIEELQHSKGGGQWLSLFHPIQNPSNLVSILSSMPLEKSISEHHTPSRIPSLLHSYLSFIFISLSPPGTTCDKLPARLRHLNISNTDKIL